MRLHHFDALSMRPPGYGLWGTGDHLVTHVIAIELDQRIILIDAGVGRPDFADPKGRLGRLFKMAAGPEFDHSRALYHQLELAKLDPSRVSDIVMTHLDIDHAGGLVDFPQAEVHVVGRELEEAESGAKNPRYASVHFEHQPQWKIYHLGEDWHGFESAEVDTPVALRFVSLPGHSVGHAGVAIESQQLLFCGDAYFGRGELFDDAPRLPLMLCGFVGAVADNNKERRSTLRKLRSFADAHPQWQLCCSHDPTEFESLAE